MCFCLKCVFFDSKNAPFQREAYTKKESKVFCQNTMTNERFKKKVNFLNSDFWVIFERQNRKKMDDLMLKLEKTGRKKR